jgi:hypothetical protein
MGFRNVDFGFRNVLIFNYLWNLHSKIGMDWFSIIYKTFIPHSEIHIPQSVVTFKNPLKQQQFMTQFENLSKGEIELLENAIPQIAILIAGADGNIDQDEKDWAAKLTHIRGYANPKALQAFYDAIDPHFNTKFGDFIHALPKNTEERLSLIHI